MGKQRRQVMDNGMVAVFAPWKSEQVRSLNNYQTSPLHPFTCGVDSRHRPLQATKRGWRCLDCSYTQNWAWKAMMDGTWETYLLKYLPQIMGVASTVRGAERITGE